LNKIENIINHLAYYTNKSHTAGSARDYETAVYTKKYFLFFKKFI